MKEIIIRYDQQFRAELRSVLAASALPTFKVAASRTPARFDFLVTTQLDGKKHRFAAECKLRPSAKDIDGLSALKLPLPPLLFTVKLSESLVRHCQKRGVNFLDLNGRVWLRAPGLLLDREQPSPTVVYRLAEAEIRFFSPKSARLARVLLSQPDRTWRQVDLAERTDLSQGLLSRLLNHAAGQGWVAGRRGDWKLAQLDAFLDAWAKADVWAKRVTLRQYSVLAPDLPAFARQLADRLKGDLAFTQWFAAELRHPYAQVPIVTAYRREALDETDQRGLDLHEVSDGGNLWLTIPRDPGVFQALQRVQDLPLVSDAQIYLDLIQAGFRGPDQAQALRQWQGFCRT